MFLIFSAAGDASILFTALRSCGAKTTEAGENPPLQSTFFVVVFHPGSPQEREFRRFALGGHVGQLELDGLENCTLSFA